MTRKKKGGGRTTPPKDGPPPRQARRGDAHRGDDYPRDAYLKDARPPEDPGMEMWEAMLAENGLTTIPADTANGNGEELGQDEDYLGVVVDHLASGLERGPGAFISDIAALAWKLYLIDHDETDLQSETLVHALGSIETLGPAVMAALRLLGVTAETRAIAKANFAESEVEPWLVALGSARVGRIGLLDAEPHDMIEFMFEILSDGIDPVTVFLAVDRVLAESTVAASATDDSFDQAATLSDLNWEGPGDLPSVDIVTPEFAADHIRFQHEYSLARGLAIDRAGLDGFDSPVGLPIAGWLIDLLPEVTDPWTGVTDEQADQMHQEFAEFTGADLTAALKDTLDGIVLLTGERNLFRWTPARIASVLESRSSFDNPNMVRDVLADFLRWAAVRNGETDLRLQQNLAFLEIAAAQTEPGAS